MAKYDKVGGGSVNYGIYRKRKTDWAAILGGLVIAGIVIAVLANI